MEIVYYIITGLEYLIRAILVAVTKAIDKKRNKQ